MKRLNLAVACLICKHAYHYRTPEDLAEQIYRHDIDCPRVYVPWATLTVVDIWLPPSRR